MPLFYDKEVRIFKTSCGPFDNNSYLIVCQDTMESAIIDAPMSPDKILEEAENSQVQIILITHNHQDHLAGLSEVIAATGAPVAIHEKDAHALPSSPSLLINDEDIVRVGNVDIRIIHTPGHTPGSVCFLVGKHLFSGDTLFPGGPGRSQSPEKLQEVLASITGKLFLLPDETYLLPGHGPESTLSESKKDHNIFFMKEHDPDLMGDVLWLEN